jgi:hypothetical protein
MSAAWIRGLLKVRPSKRLGVTVTIPIVTFVLGILTEQLLDRWFNGISELRAIVIASATLAVVTAIMTIVLRGWLVGLDGQIDLFTSVISSSSSAMREQVSGAAESVKLEAAIVKADLQASVERLLSAQTQSTGDLIAEIQGIITAVSSGLLVEFVPDGYQGESYQRATEVVRNAKVGITCVDFWEPFPDYQVETKTSTLESARQNFYDAMCERIDETKRANRTFHRRIVQVPRWLQENKIPFEVDPMFHAYLRKAAEAQVRYPKACKLRLAPVSIRMTFMIVDRRIVVMPILSHDPIPDSHHHEIRLRRYGALFFEDRTGDLDQCLGSMYAEIDSTTKALTPKDL